MVKEVARERVGDSPTSQIISFVYGMVRSSILSQQHKWRGGEGEHWAKRMPNVGCRYSGEEERGGTGPKEYLM